MDRPIADVVSFADWLAERSAGVAPGAASPPGAATDVAGEAGDREPADLARGAMFRRFAQLASAGQPIGSVDDELAILVYDSASDPDRLAGVRGVRGGDGATRQLTFQGPELTIEVEVDGARRELVCQVVPPQPVSLEVRHRSGSLDLGRDDYGTFHVPELPGETISLRCVPLTGDGEATATSWVTV